MQNFVLEKVKNRNSKFWRSYAYGFFYQKSNISKIQEERPFGNKERKVT